MIDLTDEQAIAAADSLAHELSELCRDQPSDVVMMALAGLVAQGIVMARDTSDPASGTDEEAVQLHVNLVRTLIRGLQERKLRA